MTGSAPIIIIKKCTGCGRCIAACPMKLISLETSGYRKHAVLLDRERCTHCHACLVCPVEAMATKEDK